MLRLIATLAACSVSLCSAAFGPTDLSGHPIDPFASPARVRVLLFVRTDCPITQRYAPELQRLSGEFAQQPVAFWLIFPDPSETSPHIAANVRDYRFPGTPVLDPRHVLVKRAHAAIAPEAAVFDRGGRLLYHGRIDDRYVDIGKTRPAPSVHDLEEAISATLAGRAVAVSETHAVGCSLADVE